jgi:hypothetical protein
VTNPSSRELGFVMTCHTCVPRLLPAARGRDPAMAYKGWRRWRPGERRPMTTEQSERLRRGEPVEVVCPPDGTRANEVAEAG